jgi:hypothetical protein
VPRQTLKCSIATLWHVRLLCRVRRKHLTLAVADSPANLREALQVFGSVADGHAKRRVLLAAAMVAAGALLTALTPLALDLVVG